MNIKEYYTVMSKIYLNQIILIGFFLTISFLLFSKIGFSIIFKILFSLIFFFLLYFLIRYFYFLKKEETATIWKMMDKTKMVTKSNQLLILFLPAPSLRIKLFNSNGICDCELSDENMNPWKWFFPINMRRHKPQNYLLKKRDGFSLATMKFYHRQRIIEIVTNEQKKLIVAIKEKNRKTLMLQVKDEMIMIEKTTHKIEFIKCNRNIATIHKGWMPIKWQKYFSPNTPILTIQEELNIEDQYIIYALLIHLFVNQYN